jgi:hypothetical protein
MLSSSPRSTGVGENMGRREFPWQAIGVAADANPQAVERHVVGTNGGGLLNGMPPLDQFNPHSRAPVQRLSPRHLLPTVAAGHQPAAILTIVRRAARQKMLCLMYFTT